ncbi:hypothetical protein QU481_11095 [Crenobacter sp. SG2303]|uniref:Uncharacterized protein n=1 Tax=Crenobacter oryzisoli TaxID=3056844 RepID=A0ABT7XNQ9_9NEIS|nr:hypothetical protein [Crenobacter sp. SG2303]MDN0075437.1 hypothetical protein [Crenobacter sp. SG2303]
MSQSKFRSAQLILLLVCSALAVEPALARRGGGVSSPRPNASVANRPPIPNNTRNVRTNDRNATMNNNVRVSREANVNVNKNVNVQGNNGWNDDYHPVATAAAVGATVAVTAAVVGNVVHSIPPSCTAVMVGNVAYQQCGSTWYQPQYSGTSVQYVVVNPPQ